jgi:alpha-tubulin suppressor-like RCC1 family protein
VYTWGFNGYGQLGDGSTTPHETPAPVDTTSGLADVVEVCTGVEHVLARTSTGELWAFGRNNRGQLGDGTVEDAPTPRRVQVPPGSVVACAAGDDHSLAVDASGGLWTWGGNRDGQLGDRRVESRVSPVRALGPAGASAIVASGDYYSGWHSLAIDDGGALWAWGVNQNGQLGDGTRIARGTPALVDLARVVVTAAAGPSHSLAVDSSGDVWAWGSNIAGQLGDGTTADSATPIPVLGLPSSSGAVAVAAGYGHSAALLDDGTVWAWGGNQSGQLGRDFGLLPDGTRVGSAAPVQVLGLPVITDLSSNSGSNLARDVDGNVWGWGDNRWGQLGLPESQFQPSALLVDGLSMIEDVSLGGQHGLARDVNGDVWAWGANGVGQAGEAPGLDLVAPHMMVGVAGATQVSAGGDHNLAVTSGGELWAWGGNAWGQLGDGTTVARSIPLRVGQVSGVSAISAGGAFSLSLAGPERTTTQIVTAGGAVTTDPQGLGASVGDPIQVAVASPNSGTVTIVEQEATGSMAGYALLGKEMVITAPDGTPADPLVFVFEVDASIVPLGQDASSLVLLRNGVAVPDCAAGATDASPDPCIALRETLLTGNLRLTVRTSQASVWNVAVSMTPPNTEPQVELGDDVSLVAGNDWALTGQVVDPDSGDAWTATVDYGAGTEVLTVDAAGAFQLSRVYDAAGAFPVTVTVTDAAGASVTDSLTVVVQSRKDAVLAGFDVEAGDRATVANPCGSPCRSQRPCERTVARRRGSRSGRSGCRSGRRWCPERSPGHRLRR